MPDMQNPQPTETVQGTTAGGTGDQGLANAIAAAVAAAVSTSVNEISRKLDATTSSLNEMMSQLRTVNDNVTKTASTSEADSGVVSRSVSIVDPAEDLRRNQQARDRIGVMAETNLANMIEVAYKTALQSLDHFGALPPVADPKIAGAARAAA